MMRVPELTLPPPLLKQSERSPGHWFEPEVQSPRPDEAPAEPPPKRRRIQHGDFVRPGHTAVSEVCERQRHAQKPGKVSPITLAIPRLLVEEESKETSPGPWTAAQA